MQDVQEAPSDSLQAADSLEAQIADSLRTQIADSLASLDSSETVSGIVGDISRGVNETGQLIIDGQWQQVINEVYQGITTVAVSFIPKLLSALFVLILFFVLYLLAKKVLKNLLGRSKFVDAGLESLLLKTLSVVAWLFIGIMVLAQFGINVTALLAGLSVVGIAVGFAVQDTLQNFISGITILIDRPFRLGHFIEVDGTYGKVEEITLRSTRIKTLNNEMMVMPNTEMINQKVVNHTQFGGLRIEVPFGIAYKEYPQKARQVVLGLVEGDERLNLDYDADVVVTGLNDSSVDMLLRFYVKEAGSALPVKKEYTEKILEALRKAEIEIPFPHLQLHIDEAKALESPAFTALLDGSAANNKPRA